MMFFNDFTNKNYHKITDRDLTDLRILHDELRSRQYLVYQLNGFGIHWQGCIFHDGGELLRYMDPSKCICRRLLSKCRKMEKIVNHYVEQLDCQPVEIPPE